MKKKIYFGLLFLIISFLAGGVYITTSIDKVIASMENEITLNQVEFQRKNLLNQMNLVQTDLLLTDSPHARDIDTFVRHAEELVKYANVCTSCHHREQVAQRLNHLQDTINVYLKKLSRVYTFRANQERLNEVRQNAFQVGEEIIREIDQIVILSAEKISKRINSAKDKISRTQTFVNIFLVVGPLVIVFLSLYFVKHLAESVIILTHATRRIKSGDLKYRIKPKLKDEFQELAQAFNDMADSLTEQCVRVQEAERLAVVGELAAGLAHEIKNPLAGIKVSIEVLAADLPLEQEDKEIFLQVINEIRRIENLLKSLLGYARPPVPVPEIVNANKLLEATLKNAQFSVKSPVGLAKSSKNIDFVRDFDADLPVVFVDPGQIQQVFLNLLLNAVDAIPEEGTITVRTRVKDNRDLEISIIDSGTGIDSDNFEKIFNPFFTTKSKGSGLGLAICRRLIEQHEGTIKVAANPDRGVTFTITLPTQLKKKDKTQ